MDRRKQAAEAYRRAATKPNAETAKESARAGPVGGFARTVSTPSALDRAVAGAGTGRAARLLIALGPQAAAGVLARLDAAQVERITGEIIRTPRVDREEAAELLSGAGSLVKTVRVTGGPDVARSMLRRAFGEEEGERIFYRSVPNAPAHLFAFMNDYEPAAVLNLLRDESAAAVSVILPHLERKLAAAVLAGLDEERRDEVVRRIARMSRIGREVVVRIEEALREKIKRVATAMTDSAPADGAMTLAAILRHLHPTDSDALIRELGGPDAGLARAVRERLYTIDHLALLPERSLADLLRDFSDEEIALFLKGKQEELRVLVLRCVSDRRRGSISELFAHSGPQKRERVEEATRAVLERLCELEESGAVLVPRPDDRYI